MEDQSVNLDELIFHYLHLKNYKKTCEAFAKDVGVTSLLGENNFNSKRRRNFGEFDDLDKLQKKIDEKIFSIYLPNDFVSKIVSPIRKIESAVADLNRILRSNEIGAASKSMQKTLYNRQAYSKFSKAASLVQAASNERVVDSEGVVNAEKFISAEKAEMAVGFQRSPQRQLSTTSEHTRKTPNPKSRPQFSLIGVDGNPIQYTTVAIFEPDKWNQVLDQRINHSIVPDTMAEMINNCFATGQDSEPNLDEVVHTMEGNENLMKELESILADYCSAETNLLSPSDMFREIDFDQTNDFTTLTNMEPVQPQMNASPPGESKDYSAETKDIHTDLSKATVATSFDRQPTNFSTANVQEVVKKRTKVVPNYVVKTLFPEDEPSTSTATPARNLKRQRQVVVTPDKIEEILKKLHRKK